MRDLEVELASKPFDQWAELLAERGALLESLTGCPPTGALLASLKEHRAMGLRLRERILSERSAMASEWVNLERERRIAQIFWEKTEGAPGQVTEFG
jgi:hypothetical protein